MGDSESPAHPPTETPGHAGATAPLGPAADDTRRRLLEMIGSGALGAGERLGAERDLAVELAVSRSTLRHALASLEHDGVVRRVPGRGGGTFVTTQKFARDLSSIVGVPAMLRDQGFLAGSRVMSASVVAADEVTARALGLEQGAFVLDVVRIRLADGSPISLEHARFPADRFPDLLEQSLGGSIYELLASRYGVRPAQAEERIEVVPADDDEARILGVAARRRAAVDHAHDAGRRRPADRVLARPLPRRPHTHHGPHPWQPGHRRLGTGSGAHRGAARSLAVGTRRRPGPRQPGPRHLGPRHLGP